VITKKKLNKAISEVDSKVNEFQTQVNDLERKLNTLMVSINNHQLLLTKLITQASEPIKEQEPITNEIKVIETGKKKFNNKLSRSKSIVLMAKGINFVSVNTSKSNSYRYVQTRISGVGLAYFIGKKVVVDRKSDRIIITQDEKSGVKVHRISTVSGKLFIVQSKTGKIAEGYHKAEYKNGALTVYTKIMYDDSGKEVRI
jgi:seryl-tRNA synthetase